MNSIKKNVENILRQGDIQINGTRPWDIQVHNEEFYNKVFKQGSLGLGEAYMDGWWECNELDELFYKASRSELDKKVRINISLIWHYLRASIFNNQNISHSVKVAEQHYDLGNDLYEKMLDKRMLYTCAYWKNAQSLDEAQEAKLDLICRKLQLKAGMRVLDIGCGFGSFLKFAAEKYNISGLGITISEEQAFLARKLCEGLPIEIRIQDYRKINEKFDAIASIGMFEHVGYKNFKHFTKVAHECLSEDGLLLLHTIGNNYSLTSVEPWINKYIFPGGMIPSIKQVGQSLEKLFIMEDWHNFGQDYDLTLMAWYDNLNRNWPSLQNKYSQKFYRMFKYYLLSCAGVFRARKMQLWQIVLSKNGIVGGYKPIR